jgi:hypothetical protein
MNEKQGNYERAYDTLSDYKAIGKKLDAKLILESKLEKLDES